MANSSQQKDTDELQPIQYLVTETGVKFHNCMDTTRMVCGPFGSGKSVMCIEELLFSSMRQSPASNGVRYTRWGVIRATYPALKTTTRRTLMAAFPSAYGTIKETIPMEGHYVIPLPDGTKCDIELILLAIDGGEDSINKLKSTDFTGIWINEITDVPSDVYTQCLGRIGRYPGPDRAPDGITRSFLIADYNKPSYTHWISDLEKSPPPSCTFFYQPPAAFKVVEDGKPIRYKLNPDAENLRSLSPDYYRSQIESRIAVNDLDSVDVLFCLLPGGDKSGKPIWKDAFDRRFHVAPEVIQPLQYTETFFGCDTSGIHPCILIAQFIDGRFVILDEVYGDGVGFSSFISSGLLPLLRGKYSTSTSISGGCDPANAKDAWEAITPIQRLQDIGMHAVPASTNATRVRIEAVSELLNRRNGGILISPNCVNIIGALDGGYKWKPTNVHNGASGTTYSTVPIKNQFSHYADALQYLSLYLLDGAYSSSSNNNEVKSVVQHYMSSGRVV